jgi:S-DNA-T family DNA segregation ATPase FtsK/SpoIIIE
MAVVVGEGRDADWDWAKWLPHVRADDGATRLLAAGREAADALLGSLLEAGGAEEGKPGRWRAAGDDAPRGRTRLLVLDDITLTEGRRAPARLLLGGRGGPVAGIVIADTPEQLPAVVSTVVVLASDLGDAEVSRPQEGSSVGGVVTAGLRERLARETARNLARWEDPEFELVGAGLPGMVRLLPLLGLAEEEGPLDDALASRWTQGRRDPALRAPVGVGEDGVVWLDLVRDGPHGLVGGTTGSGKSELLRSLVAGLAASQDPDHLVFVLVDYKGGSAFAECAGLPHTVGMVTDLDGHLGERALQSLEAELHHRERVLRDAEASDLPEYLRAGTPLGPMPRLVVVIDEFATLATELPDFLGALVGIAQRGRSLGVHLILATQRPSGAVNANIKANTNLRIALRVQDAADSSDVIDTPDAATIRREQPGRAYVRLGPGEVVAVQTPLSTAAAPSGQRTGVRLAPFRFGLLASDPPPVGAGSDGATDLTRLVAAARGAFEASGAAPPREPWLEMLADEVPLADLLADLPADGGSGGGAAPGPGRALVPFALADEPEHQRRAPAGWRPDEGHLAVFGMVGSGTTTALRSVAAAVAATHSPDDCHLYALDFGGGGLADLAELPHVGAVIGATDVESQLRLIRLLRRELDRRRDLDPAARAEEPRIVVLIDGIGAFLAEHESVDAMETAESFRRVFSEGAGVGISFLVSGDRPGEIPMRLGSLVSQRFLLRLADPSEFSLVGVRAKDLPAFVPGRALDDGGRVVQIALPPEDLSTLAAGPAARRPPERVGSLPAALPLEALPPAVLEPHRLRIPVGLADADLSVVELELHDGDHAVIAGQPRSGVTSTLAAIAASLRAADPGMVLIGVCETRSALYDLMALDAAGSVTDLAHVLRAAPGDERRWVVLVDDAGRVDDVDGVLAAVVGSGRPGLHVVAGGRADDLRGGYGHWSRGTRSARTGVLLQPNLATDGEVFGLRLPRRLPVPLVAGRGFVVNAGEPVLAQVAQPPADEPAATAPA